MSDLIIEDGPETPPTEPAGIPWWGGLSIGVLLGLAAAFLFFSDAGRPAGEASTTTAPFADLTIPTTSDAADPLALPTDFGYGVAVVVRTNGQGYDLVEIDRPDIPLPPNRFSLPLGIIGSLPKFDFTGHSIAATIPTRFPPGAVLLAGVVSNIRVVQSGVTGFVFDDSQAGLVAFTTGIDDLTQLWLAGPQGAIQNVATRFDIGGAFVVAHGEWGWALQDSAGENVHVLDPAGEPIRNEPGEFHDSLPDGTLLLRHEGQPVIVDHNGSRRVVSLGPTERDVLRVLDGVGDWWVTKFAPDTDRIAFLGGRGMAIVDRDRVSVHSSNPELPILVTNDDYAMYPQRSGVVVVDLTSRREFVILPSVSVRAIQFLDR